MNLATQNKIAAARKHARSELLAILAGSLTPSTLAAVITDLDENFQETDRLQALHDEANHAFECQLVCMEGKDALGRLEPKYQNSPAGRVKVQVIDESSHGIALDVCSKHR